MPTYVSKERLEAMKQEIIERKGKIRREIAERISVAKELGDLSENFEYHDAKDQQGYNEVKISQLESEIRDAIIIEDKSQQEIISLGCTFEAMIESEKKTFSIVGSSEADPMAGKISNESPLGQAFLGHAKGDVVEVKTPGGIRSYLITRIS